MAGGLARTLLRLFDRFPMVGDPPPDSESVSSTLDRVLLKKGIVVWVRAGRKVHPLHVIVDAATQCGVTKCQRQWG